MQEDEHRPLLGSESRPKDNYDSDNSTKTETRGLSLLFATLCIIDLFGVFPVVTMPRSIIDCGWVGIPLVFGVFILQIYTATLLGRCWIMAEKINPLIKLKSRQPYAALAEMTYGPVPGRLVTILLDLTVFAGGVPNLLVASQNMQLLGEKAAMLKWDISYCYWMPLIGLVLCPFMWLGSPKDMKFLVVSSSGVVMLVTLLTCISISGDDILTPRPPIPAPSWEAIAIAYGILAFQFDVHPMILTVQVDMADKMKLGQAIVAAFFVTGTLFLVTGVLATIWYGSELEYNLLRSLPSSELVDINVLFVTLQICLSTVVGCTTLFQDLEERLGIKKEFNLSRCILRTSLLLFAILLSEVVPRFDLIMGLVGGSMMGPLMFILPPLFYARLRAMEPQPDLDTFYEEDDFMSPGARDYSVKSAMLKYYYEDPKSFFKKKQKTGDKNYEKYSYERLTDDEDDEIIKKSFPKRLYSKVKNNFLSMICLDSYPKIGPMVVWEKFKTSMIVSAGLLATILSTYYSLSETIIYARFTPPCLVNVTAATLAIE